jgi:hypothetical protein
MCRIERDGVGEIDRQDQCVLASLRAHWWTRERGCRERRTADAEQTQKLATIDRHAG